MKQFDSLTLLILIPEPVEAPPYPPVGGLTYAWGLMLRDIALLLVNRPKKNLYIFS